MRGGHPGLEYQYRPSSVRTVLAEARRWSDRVLITHGSRVVTFAEHESLVHRIAPMLRGRGITPGERVGILAANSPEWVATFFAILEIGAVVVPFSGWWAAEEVAYAAGVVDPVLIVTDEARQSGVPRGVPFVSVSELGDGGVDGGGPGILPEPDENAPAVILFTAGTIAFPKEAVLPHRALIANLQTLLVVARKLPQDILTTSNQASHSSGFRSFISGPSS